MTTQTNITHHLAQIVLAAGERIKAIRTHGVDSMESLDASINYSRACIDCNRDNGITTNEWHSIYPTRRMLDEVFAQECKRAFDLEKCERAVAFGK